MDEIQSESQQKIFQDRDTFTKKNKPEFIIHFNNVKFSPKISPGNSLSISKHPQIDRKNLTIFDRSFTQNIEDIENHNNNLRTYTKSCKQKQISQVSKQSANPQETVKKFYGYYNASILNKTFKMKNSILQTCEHININTVEKIQQLKTIRLTYYKKQFKQSPNKNSPIKGTCHKKTIYLINKVNKQQKLCVIPSLIYQNIQTEYIPKNHQKESDQNINQNNYYRRSINTQVRLNSIPTQHSINSAHRKAINKQLFFSFYKSNERLSKGDISNLYNNQNEDDFAGTNQLRYNTISQSEQKQTKKNKQKLKNEILFQQQQSYKEKIQNNKTEDTDKVLWDTSFPT